MKRKTDVYESFDEHLELDFGSMDIRTQTELKVLMTNQNYHIKRNKKTKKLYRKEPTQKQLVYAWTYLKKEGTMTLRENKEFRQERGHIRRALKVIYIGGKKYNPGQFIPYE